MSARKGNSSPWVTRESLGLSGEDAALSSTQGLCNTCGRLVDAKLVVRGERVLLVKWCPKHGLSEGLVSSDREWTARAGGYLKPGTNPRQRAVTQYAGCPTSCGLCSEHQQHTCVPLLEITPSCDMSCPICLVVDRVRPALTLPELDGILDKLVACEGRLNMLTLTGGEPTQHPQFLDVVDRCLRPEIGILSISTNGLWIEKDEGLVRALADRGVVISLQVDGFDSHANQRLRGQPGLGERKRRAIERVLQLGGRLSLTFTLAKDTNEHELPAVLELLFKEPQVLSLMVQPLACMGVRPTSDLERLTLPDAVKLLVSSSNGALRASDFTPLPCSHPYCFALTYLLKLKDGSLVSLPSLIDAEAYLNLIQNQALVGTDRQNLEGLRDALYRLWSSDGIMPQRETLLSTMKQLILELGRPGDERPHREVLELGTRNIKSVFIHHFMDRSNFDLARVVKCCNHYPQVDGRLLPACVRNNGLC
jgi:7,8-dihydro-6-hydroxymethylpterin dimethyltransferase